MEFVHTAFRDFAASSVATTRSPVWRVHEFPIAAPPAISTGVVVELPLFTLNPRGYEYYVYIGIGSSPTQYMRVLLDTMSSDLSILGFAMRRHELYDHSKSKSYVANNTLVRTALPGSEDKVLGALSQDTITLHQTLRIKNQSFTELLDRPEIQFFFGDTHADGWLGLARASRQQAYAVPSILANMLSAKGHSLREPIIGIHFNPLSTGLVSFGGVEPTRFHGNLSFVEILSPGESGDARGLWRVALDAVLINSKPVELELSSGANVYAGGSAVLDSVLPVIHGPRDVITAINAALGETDEQKTVPCHEPGDGHAAPLQVTLVLGGKSFTLGHRDLVAPALQGSGCVSLVAHGQVATADWHLGAPFMDAFYTALDFGDSKMARAPRIGFAPSVRDEPPSFSAYDSLWLGLLVVVVVLIWRSIARKKDTMVVSISSGIGKN